MKEKRFWFGFAVSAAWLGWMGWQLYYVGLPKELNEQGDFFAGFFAPLAFLWLVLGYLQQGEELRQSSEALRLQAEELKNSVEQQSLLVDVSRKQLDAQVEAIAEERRLRLEAQFPVIGLTSEGTTGTSHLLRITNTGGSIWRLFLNLTYAGHPPQSIQYEGLAKDSSLQLSIDKTKLGELRIAAFFAVQDGSLGAQHVRIVVEEGGLTYPHLMTVGLEPNA